MIPALSGCLVAGLTVCGLGLASGLAPGAFSAEASSGVFSASRLSYPLNYYNAVAARCTVTIGLALSLSAHLDRRWARAAGSSARRSPVWSCS